MAKLKTGRHTGAIKAFRKSQKRERANRAVLKKIRLAAKELKEAFSKKSTDQARTLLPKVYSLWDRAARHGVVHWKAAARKKSRLAQQAAQLLSPPPQQ
ncbi:MAG: 30S ribosomal protein S20 [Elusimicrobia bacterium]|nr:30S ribosomal protein S20 [Elusimicrobiota bacterium]